MTLKKIPALGIIGEAALREASSTEYGQVMNLVRAALSDKYGPSAYVGIEAMYADRVIICKDGRYFQLPYTLGADNAVTLGDPQEVVEQYTPVRESSALDATFKEAAGSEGKVWDVILVRAGVSGNNILYSDAVLREAVPLFEGARCYVKADADHQARDDKNPEKIFGWFDGVKFVEGKSTNTGYMAARLNVAAGMSALRETIVDAWKRGKTDLVALSINAYGKMKAAGKKGAVRIAESISKVSSVDLIVEPGAGGALVRLVEAAADQENDDMKLKERMLEAIKIKAPRIFAAINADTISDTDLEARYAEAQEVGRMVEAIKAKSPAIYAKLNLAVISDTDLQARYTEAMAATQRTAEDDETPLTRGELRMVEARAYARVTIAEAKLPAPAKDKLKKDFAARERFTEAEVDTAITDERAYLSRMTESGRVQMAGLDIQVEDRSIKVKDMFDAFFDPKHKDHRKVQSFRECYIEVTGDRKVSGRIENCDLSRIAESVGEAMRESLDSTSFSLALGDSITRRMVAEYNQQSQYDSWRQIATTTPVSDFRTQERTIIGGYGDLPTVTQGDAYAALASPTDKHATYSVAKRGGTEDVTLEMIKNDDAGTIRRIPIKLARSAKRTLGKFVFDFIRTNPNIYDGVAFFHANHNNLGTTALSATELGVARIAMLKQQEQDSGDVMSIPPKTLMVPIALQETAWNIFQRNTNLDKTFIETMVLSIIPVWYWTDATDWAIGADPMDLPGIEVGFLDGQEEPQIFVQDMPNVGSMFTNDKITYKIRHIYGGNVLPGGEKAFFKEVVAG